MTEGPAPIGAKAPVHDYIDMTKPSIARVYDASLGGKDNYAVDREALKMVLEAAPHQGDVSKLNRKWLIRVVRFLADDVGIDQFLDCGAGLPTAENTHEIAQRHHPENTVVYVDNDPACNVHGRALLEQNDHTHFVAADLTEPDTLMSLPAVSKHLDLDKPLALILCGILHHVDDSADPVGIMRSYIDRLPSGSYVAITHFWDPADGSDQHELARDLEERFTALGLGSGWYRTREQIASYFGDLEMVKPGLTELYDWWPDGPMSRQYPEEGLILGGVARKP
ncbi:MAG TPA: SAM-dependent methyltransferase [Jiangellaceae bacterium]